MILETITLLLSLVVIFKFFYIKYLIRQLKNISSDIVLIKEMLAVYQESLLVIHNSELFYGEPVIEALVEDTKVLLKDLEEISSDYQYAEEVEFQQEETTEVEN